MADSPTLQLIAVHGGAGVHPKSADPDVKRALRLACTSASTVFARSGEAALPTVCGAISILEDDECLNAGYGSNLTSSGTAECDASVMDGHTGDFGAVGSVSGVKNPIKLAHEILRYSRKADPLGRIPPLILVSSGASEFAKSNGLQCPSESLISPRARREWVHWNSKLDATRSCAPSGGPSNSTGQLASPLMQVDGLHDRQDTVGAVAWDADGHLAAGVSSGGLLLKLPGRIGEAAIYGAGCWATPRTACSVSGAGEHITRMSLAREICEAVEAAGKDEGAHDVLQRILGRDFLRTSIAQTCTLASPAVCGWFPSLRVLPPYRRCGVLTGLCSERGERTPQAGVLLLVKEVQSRDDSDSNSAGTDSDMASDSEGGNESNNPAACNASCGGSGQPTMIKPRLWCAFTTESMAVGYTTSLCPKPSAAVLRRPPRAPGSSQGPSVYITALPLDC
ncbi:N-terminal nucleophile aminohydrolase [Ganoderma leucocontextum]|nr:N-terminal nucleophile aminohydrolase [Ganoderma leucocontextum]